MTVTCALDHCQLRLRVRSPEEKHLGCSIACKRIDERIGEYLPALVCMARRHTFLDRQDGVEQQHTLARPTLEIARGQRLTAYVRLQFEKDVAKAWREARAIGNRKRKSVRLAG